jgi:hypothetical protein
MFSVQHSSENLKNFPQELGVYIMSKLDPKKDIGAVACVSKEWNRLASLNELWHILFIKAFQEKAPEGEHAKIAFLRKYALPIENEAQLRRLFAAFWCALERNKKKRIECIFSTNPPSSIVAEQGFALQHGFRETAGETTYYKYIGKVPKDLKLNKNKIIDSYRLGNVCVLQSTNEKIYSNFYTSCFSINVEVDVGDGNTLGYYSSINNWEKPFKLTCVQANNKNSWMGFIPCSEFKFIKIDHKGKITWENGISENQPRRHCDLQTHPITFPKYTTRGFLQKIVRLLRQ